MRTSLKKLRGLAIHKHDIKDRRDLHPVAQLDELAQASQDMQDMKDCYDSLLSAAAATANSAYEFSESLREMGACLLEKTALNDDEDSGKVLLMLGKVQFELQKLVDSYRSHIFKTITSPSESLLNELRTVEEMKRQCDEKRDIYEYMRMRQREKGRSRTTKGESFSSQQLETARDEYDEEATLFVFRLKSLKQGQSRSLLTQAARHHASQLCFFKKALKSLEAVEPHVKWVTEQQHIDYHFSGLEDDGEEDNDDDDDDDDDDDHANDDDESYKVHDDGELSFDYGENDHAQDLSTSRNSMEVDQVDLIFPQVEAVKENLDRFQRKSLSFRAKMGSQSAPLFNENKFDAAERLRQMRPPSAWKFRTYVLPTPIGTKSSISTGLDNPVPHTMQPETGLSKLNQNPWHSSPLEPRKYEKMAGYEKISGHTVINSDSILKESNNNISPTRLPPPLTEGLSVSWHNVLAGSEAKKIKRQAFSGPLTSNQHSSKPISMGHPQLFSGPILRNPTSQPPWTSPKASVAASPTFMSTPKISELHELPRPPTSSTLNSSRPSGLIGYSGPLVSKRQVLNKASPLPAPPQFISRSFSIPSRDPRETMLHPSKVMEASPNSEMSEDISPPLTPLTISNG